VTPSPAPPLSEPDAAEPTDAEPTDAEPTDAEPAALHGCPLVDSLGAAVVHVDAARYLDLMKALRDDGYDMLVGVTGVDYLTHPGRDVPAGVTAERFEVVVELASIPHHRRLRVRCQVPGDDPAVPTLFELWPGSEAHERETYDMFGVRFDGHPDPTRILMPEDWEGHPLRKDYATGHVPVQFKESPGAR
jgi:NADH-quinone oxidoreductase subunit C